MLEPICPKTKSVHIIQIHRTERTVGSRIYTTTTAKCVHCKQMKFRTNDQREKPPKATFNYSEVYQ